MLALLTFIVGLFSGATGSPAFNVNVLDSFLTALAGFLGSFFS